MEFWIQGALFEDRSDRTVTSRRVDGTTKSRGTRSVGRLDWSRVTRDPAVAASYGNATRAASDFRVGLAKAYDKLSLEQRLAIRAALDPSRRRDAA